jgi:hypothetical protein
MPVHSNAALPLTFSILWSFCGDGRFVRSAGGTEFRESHYFDMKLSITLLLLFHSFISLLPNTIEHKVPHTITPNASSQKVRSRAKLNDPPNGECLASKFNRGPFDDRCLFPDRLLSSVAEHLGRTNGRQRRTISYVMRYVPLAPSLGIASHQSWTAGMGSNAGKDGPTKSPQLL